ncbi:MAG: 4Fe-4S dicluster domain-containing protein [Oscillospiraceae bacterium]|nr:4Fe-4S dicluster domain-containing protein [Oscillospiraceae bacterium]
MTDDNFKKKVAAQPGGEHVLDCFLCGTCTAGCPISEIDEDFNPRKIMRQILNGSKDETLSGGEIWKCYQCHTCVAHCPQDVRFADIVRALRELAVSEGFCDSVLVNKIKEIDIETRKQRLESVKILFSK